MATDRNTVLLSLNTARLDVTIFINIWFVLFGNKGDGAYTEPSWSFLFI